MNTVIDRPQMPLNRVEGVTGFLPARHGVCTAAHPVYPLPNVGNGAFSDVILGQAFFHGTPVSTSGPEISYLIVLRGLGIVYAHQCFPPIYGSANYPYATVMPGVPLGVMQYGGDGYASFHLRSVMYQGELFLCWDSGASQPMRVTKESGILKMWRVGIYRPGAGTVDGIGTGSFVLADGGAGGAMAAGTYNYRITFADERFRESSPSTTQSITQLVNHKVTVTVTWSGDEQVKYAYIYRAAQGTSDYYRVTPDGLSVDYLTRTGAATLAGTDNTTEANLVVSPLAPRPGQNDVPNKATMCAIHKNRLVLNDMSIFSTPTDLESLDRIQLSNTNAPTQFSSVGTADYPDDGAQFVIGSDRGDQVTGVHSWGSLLMTFKRESRYSLYGDDLSSWEVRRAELRGCTATDTIVEANGTLAFLSTDGMYELADETTSRKISGEIDNKFTGFTFKS